METWGISDEMNIFIPQSIQTKVELEEIANVKKQLISPSTSSTCIGIVQDGMLGSYNLTDDRIKVDWRSAMNMISYTSIDDFEKFKKKDITGKELFSMIIPNKITMDKGGVKIDNGNVISGKINKSILGAKKENSAIHYVWDEYGEDICRDFIDDVQKLVNHFNLWNGMTIGVGDGIMDKAGKEELDTYLDQLQHTAAIDITNIENNPNLMDHNAFESKLFSDYNVVRDQASKIAMKNVPEDNKFKIMITSGAKGKEVNIGQIAGSVGFQAFEGGMMQKTYNDRTLCYFHENDDRPVSRGLCHHAYIDGLDFPEFIYHIKAGREGIIEQVVKTSETGYAQRKLVVTMEDAMIKYDGTVRNANNQIIQFTYGGTGADTTKQYKYIIKVLTMDNDTIKKEYTINPKNMTKEFDSNINQKLINEIIILRNQVRKSMVYSTLNYISFSDKFYFPVNLYRIISSYKGNMKNNKVNDLKPEYVINKIKDVIKFTNTPVVCGSTLDKNNIDLIEDDKLVKMTFYLALLDGLNVKKMIETFDKKTFDEMIDKIKSNFNDNIVEPGEMVGIVAGQSMGEAVTQMTLNAFHHSGIASLTHGTSGVPRINELISATKNQKTPQMFVYMINKYRDSREASKKIGSFLEKTTIGNIRDKLQVFYDKNPKKKNGFMEIDGMDTPFYGKKKTNNSCQASIDNLPWLIRININKEKLLEKELTLLDIASEFCSWWQTRHVTVKKGKDKKKEINELKKITSMAVLINDENDPDPMLHIRFNCKDLDKVDKKGGNEKFDRETIISLVNLIDNFKLKGVQNIDKINAIVRDNYTDILDGDSMKKGKEQIILTAGVNLKMLRYIKGIDVYRSYSNDIHENYKNYGIFYAKNSLRSEFVRAYENAGNDGCNIQHISLLVDIMSYSGSILPANRHGINKSNIDPLTKASFEKTVEVLLAAAVFSDSDKMRSVSSRLYTGQAFKGGTGYCELMLDTNMIMNSEYYDNDSKKSKSKLETNTIANAILNTTKDGEEDFYIP